MISSNVGPTDFKSLTNKSSKAPAREEDSSFQNEMIESEKKMKKKTKVDGRENMGASSQHAQRAHHSKNKDEASAPKARTSKPSTPSVQNQATAPAQTNQGSPSKSTAASGPEASSEAMMSLLAEEMANLEGEVGLSATASKGGIDLKGLQLVQPQPLLMNVGGEGEASPELMQQLESITSAMPVQNEKTAGDLLSQNPEQGFSGLDMTSDFAALQNMVAKDSASTNQIFSNVLEAKMTNTDQIKQENIENLVTQASAILKDGGGEMKMQLRPEGMGTVDLKVGLQDGQVSVEIMTQDQNVKKMFEDSVFDIRSALETQNLKVDTFRVGVSEHFDQSMGQQAANQFAEREFARNFMGQFRDDRQALRNQGIDSMINNNSPFSSKPEGLSPAASVKNINGRLNIIA